MVSGKWKIMQVGWSRIFHFPLSTFHLKVPKVTFTFDGKQVTVEAEEGETLLEAALREGIPMEHACGGNGFCTTCRCKVNKGVENLSPRNDREENMGISEDPDRLGCQATVKGDVEVELSEE